MNGYFKIVLRIRWQFYKDSGNKTKKYNQRILNTMSAARTFNLRFIKASCTTFYFAPLEEDNFHIFI